MRYKQIVFLDEEGTGLSPYAHILLKQKLEEHGLGEIDVTSRGIVVLFPEPANQKIAELVRLKGLSLEDYQAEQVDGSIFSDTTLVLTFQASGKQKIYDNFPNAVNVYTFREYVGELGDISLPLGGSLEEYRSVCAVVDRVIDRLIEIIEEYESQQKKQDERDTI